MSADLGNTSVISPTDASNASGTMPSWSGAAAPSTIDDAGRAFQGATAREWENRSYPTATGTAPAFVVTYTVAPAALRSGQTYTFTAHAAAVGTDTLNANALGAKGIKKVVAGTKTATAANDFYAGDKIACVYDGTDMVWANKTTTDLSAYAALASANVFTASQTVRSTDAGAGIGPDVVLDRNSATPAANDLLGSLQFIGRDSGANSTLYNYIYSQILDATNGSEDAILGINAIVAGADTTVVKFGNGIFTPNATGGAQGADTINAKAIYDDGVLLTPGGSTLLGSISTASGTEASLTSLVLTDYKFLELIWRGASTGGSVSYLIGNSSSDDVVVTQATGGASGAIHGETKIKLSTGEAVSTLAIANGGAPLITAVTTAITTASTVVYVNFGGGTGDAGSIDVVGRK